MADRNPWYDNKFDSTHASGTFDAASFTEYVSRMGPYYANPFNDPRGTERQVIMVANAQPHEREGQNVMFADGHAAFAKTSDVAVKNDNIYTVYSTALGPPDQWRIGQWCVNPSRSLATEVPQGIEDSFLVNDYATTGSLR